MDKNRELLLGILAINFELITFEQFEEAYRAWSKQSETTLRELLISVFDISPDQVAVLEKACDKQIQNANGDVLQALEARMDQEVRELIEREAEADVDDDVPSFPAIAAREAQAHYEILSEIERSRSSGGSSHSRDRSSRYSLTKIQGQGGVGLVWLARDLVLQRNVALKEPILEKIKNESDLNRFVQEAQVTGQLEHPNIVPVYEMVHDRETREVYYTMRFVRGRTLMEVIAEYHEKLAAGTAKPVDLRELLNILVAVCHGVAYAHSRDVIHRDLKPANIMVGSFGEVSVLDWGLAKMAGNPDVDPASKVQIPETLNIDQSSDGSVLGTVAFMSPEQAAGRMNEIDPRSDIYGLGAILFCILTNTGPHQPAKTEDKDDALKKIIAGPTPRAKDLKPTMSFALDAICAKAMAFSRPNRYATAMDLALDINHWLADEDVSACPTPLSVRIARNLRKHFAVAMTSLIAMLLISVISIIAYLRVGDALQKEAKAVVQTKAALQQETKALGREADAKREATRWFRQSQKTVDTMLTGVGDVLEYYPGAKVIRHRLLEEAARSYDEFANENSTDPALRIESARAAIRLGDVRSLLGEYSSAQDAYLTGIKIFEKFAAEEGKPEFAIEAALGRAKAGTALGDTEMVVAAESEFEKAIALLNSLAASPAVDVARVTVLLNRARMYVRGKAEKAKADLEACEKSFVMLQPQLGNSALLGTNEHKRLMENRALAHSLLGQTLATAESAESAKMLERSIESYQQLTQQNPDYPPYVDGRAFGKITLANVRRNWGREDEQIRLLKEAEADYLALLSGMPEVPRFLENLSVARTNFAWIMHQRGENPLARTVLDEALAELSALCASPVRIPRYFEQVALTATVLAEVLAEIDEADKASTNLKSAIAVYQNQLLNRDPTSPRYLRGRGTAKRHFAKLLQRSEAPDAVTAMFASAMEDLRAAMKLEDEPYARDELALALENLGDLLVVRGEKDEAILHYGQALEIRRSLPSVPEYRYKWALLASKSFSEKIRDQALSLASDLVKEAPQVSKYQTLQGSLYLERNDASTAIKILKAVDENTLSLNSPHYFWLALAYASDAAPGSRDLATTTLARASEMRRTHAPGKIELRDLEIRVKKKME